MQVFEKNGHQVVYGDTLEYLRSMPDECVDLIFCDPPYNIGKNFNGRKEKWASDQDYLSWCYQWIELCIKKLKPTGTIYLMAATQNMPYIDIFIRPYVTILSRIIWYYDSSGVQARKYFGSLYEPILHCVKNPRKYTFNAESILIEAPTGATRKLIDYRKAVPTMYSSTKVPGNVWQIPRVRYRMPEYENHPTQKPIELLKRIIIASSNPGDLVLDPFSGTFTTSFVAQQNGRHSIGIDVEEEYIKIGLRRLDICKEYRGETLQRPCKSYEQQQPESIENLPLFNHDKGTSLHGYNS
ncbi:Site-specific DNA-methyltransferase (adenine-specific) [Crinalium epipsammum PCC 9333]|uniref:Methyltransferase n=1 Tax=Crinalium epipsammum PCC 9333 TaxID=1173022 RepID=K9W206_9CYAN|nr:adenine-specific DNA-methyltransferase [Crinalium epipsammum]AFZ13834.1 Site-specific DNA-methyltransferase (adenine-specific) [Crinalium epipsammum PCC 9333]